MKKYLTLLLLFLIPMVSHALSRAGGPKTGLHSVLDDKPMVTAQYYIAGPTFLKPQINDDHPPFSPDMTREEYNKKHSKSGIGVVLVGGILTTLSSVILYSINNNPNVSVTGQAPGVLWFMILDGIALVILGLVRYSKYMKDKRSAS